MNLAATKQYLILIILLSLFTARLYAEPPHISSESLLHDPVIHSIKCDYGEADEKINELLKRRWQCGKENTPFLVPEFDILVKNINADISSWLKYGMLTEQEQHVLGWLREHTDRLSEKGFPYEETLLITARYTLIITLLHQRADSQLLSTPKYRGAPCLQVDDILKDDLFTNNKYLDKAGESLLTAMLCLPKWLADPDIMLYPEHEGLSKKDFIQISPFPFYLLGVSRASVTEADDDLMSPGGFFGHDLDHTECMLDSWKEDVAFMAASASDLNPGNVIQKRIQVRNRSVALFSVFEGKETEALTDKLFDLMHEYGRSPLTQRHIHFYDRYQPWWDSLYLLHENKVRIHAHRFFKWLDRYHIYDNDLERLKHYAQDYLVEDQHIVKEKLKRISGWGEVYDTVRKNEKLCQKVLQKYCDFYSVGPALVEKVYSAGEVNSGNFALWLDKPACREWFIEILSKDHKELLYSIDSLPPEFSRPNSPFNSGVKEQAVF